MSAVRTSNIHPQLTVNIVETQDHDIGINSRVFVIQNFRATKAQPEKDSFHSRINLPFPTVACSRERSDLQGIEEQCLNKVMSDLNGKALTSMDSSYQMWWKPGGTVAEKALLRVP